MTYPNTVEEQLNPNLLLETLGVLSANGKTEEDILWVGNDTHKTTWENFKSVADFKYDCTLGCAEVATDLMIVGKDWWLTRETYDGSEWWAFREYPKMPTQDIDLKAVSILQSRQSNNYYECEARLLPINGVIE